MKKIFDIHLVAFFLIGIIMLISFRAIMFTDKIYFDRDLQLEHAPARIFTAESLIKGEIPLWNPYSQCGIPFMANMVSAVWYPLSILFYLFHFVAALKIYYLLHFILFAFFGYLFGRRSGLTAMGGLIIGILFSLNGYNMTKLEFLCNASAALWLPLMIMFRGYPFFLGMLFSFSFFAGSNQQMIFQLFGIILFAVLIRRFSVKSGLHLMLGGLCAILLSSIQFFPTLEMYLQSYRYQIGFSQQESSFSAFTIKDFIGLIAPYSLTTLSGQIYGEKFYWAKGMHIGITAGIFAFLGFVLLRLKEKLICGGVLAMLMVFSMGNNLPVVFRFLHTYMPFINAFRFPSLMSYLVIFICVLLCMKGLRRIPKQYHAVIFVLIFGELLALNAHILPLMPADFYHTKGPVISYLQKQLKNARFILSPDTQRYRNIFRQPSLTMRWCLNRDMLYGNIGVPYHFRNVSGFENLQSKESDYFIRDLYRLDNLTAFMTKGEEAKIKYTLCAHPIDTTYKEYYYPGWINILRNPYEDERTALNVFYYEGWKAYCEGREIKVFKDTAGWRQIGNEYAGKDVRFLYRPLSFNIGLWCTLLMILLILIRSGRLMHE